MKPIRALGRLMAYRPILYSIDCALWIMVHAALLIPGLLAKAFFDSLPTEAGGVAPSAPSSLFVIALMLAFALARVLHIYLSAAVDIVHRFTMSSLLRANAFAATFDAPGASPLPASPSESLDYLKVDAEQVEDAISWTLDVIGSFAFSAIALATLFAIDPIVTALAFVPLVVVVAIAQAAESKVSRYREAARSSSERATGAIGEAFQAVQAIKVAGAEEGALRHLAELGEDRRKASLKDGLFSQLLDSIYHNTVGIGTGIILLVVASRVSGAQFSLGDFSLFIFCLAFVSDYTCFWGGFLAHYQQTKVSLERLAKLSGDGDGSAITAPTRLAFPLFAKRAGREPGDYRADEDPYARLAPLDRLSVEGLSFSYAPGKGIEGVSFEVRRGELVVVTGKIGSGKTTLLRAIAGLLPGTGTVRWNGEAIGDRAACFVPPRSAYVAQSPYLFSESVAENVRLGLPLGDDEVRSSLERAAFSVDLAAMPEGLRTKVGPRGRALSGGQAQRVAVARALSRRTSLLLFDDVSSALDAPTEAALWRRLLASGDSACIAASHRRATLEAADAILVLDGGRAEWFDGLRSALAASEAMRELWEAGASRS
jgi:ATP-binding cassette subfamily B protein